MDWKRVMQDVQVEAFRTHRTVRALELSKDGYVDLLRISQGVIVHDSTKAAPGGVKIASIDNVDIMVSHGVREDEIFVHFACGEMERWSGCLELGRSVCSHPGCKIVREVLES